MVSHDALEEVLVHAEGRGGDAGAHVGHARELEQALHRPVLPERTVQDRQHDLDLAERPQDAVGRDRNGQRLGRVTLSQSGSRSK